MATTSVITGRFVLPDNVGASTALVRFVLSGFDTDQTDTDVIAPYERTVTLLENGDLPSGVTLWRNERGIRSTRYQVFITFTLANAFCAAVENREVSLGFISIGSAASYDIADLFDQAAGPFTAGGVVYPTLAAAVAAAVAAANEAAINAAAGADPIAATAAADRAEAAADAAEAYAKPYANRAALIAATIPADINRVSFFSGAVGTSNLRTMNCVRSTVAGCATSNGGTVNWAPDGDITPLHFGAVAYSSFSAASAGVDASGAFQAALDYAQNRLASAVVLPDGRYKLDAPIFVRHINGGFIGGGANNAVIVCTHVSGEAIRFQNDRPIFRGVRLAAFGPRAAALYDVASPGVRIEQTDVDFATSTRTRGCDFHGATIEGHPGSGIYVVGAQTGLFTNVWTNNNKGHGYHFAEEILPRDHFADVPGLCEIITGQMFANGGHAVYCEGPNAFSSPAVRIGLINNEIGGNATNASVRAWPSEVYLRGAQFTVARNVFKPAESNTTIEAWYISGIGIEVLNNRYINCVRAGTISSHSTLPTSSVRVNGMQMISHPGPYNPLVLVRKETGAPDPTDINVEMWSGGAVDRVVATDATMGSGGANRVPGLRINGQTPTFRKYADTVINNSTTLIDDPDLRVWLRPNEIVYLEAVLSVTGNNAADFRASFFAPSGASRKYTTQGGIKNGDADIVSTSNTQTIADIAVGITSNEREIALRCYVANGATAGWAGVRYAQLVANASNTTVYAGVSHLRVTRVTE